MAWKNLTFILIPHSQSKIKQYKFPRAAVIGVVSFMLIAICIMIFYIIGFQSKEFHQKNTMELNRQNEILKEIVGDFDSSLAAMSAEIDSIELATDKIRKESNISDKDLKFDDRVKNKKAETEYKLSVDRLMKYIDRVEKKSDIFDRNFNVLYEKCMKNKDYLKGLPSIRPAKGFISKDFSFLKRPNGVTFNDDSNSGVSIVHKEGTPIVATADGVVAEVSFSEDLGRYVVINHLNGYRTRYTHMLYQGGINVKPGDKVARGKVIGYMGRTGSSTLRAIPSHVMYSVERKGNPNDYFFATMKDSLDTPSEQIQ
jgi:murein DD-endopeptidase MepM/ murein hydrolase activator NlpD